MNLSDLRHSAISGLIYRFAERISAQLVSAVVTIILARILLPEEYGIVSIVVAIITILNVFVESGLGVALIQKPDSDQLDFSTVFWASIVFAILLYAIMFVAAPFIADQFEEPVLTPVIRVMNLRLILAAINSVQNAYVSKKLMFKKFFFATLTGTVLSGIVGISMAYLKFGVWALVFQYLTNTAVDTVFLFLSIKWYPSFRFSFPRFQSLFSFGWKVLVSGMLSAVYEEVRSFIIAGKYSKADLAFYTKGQQFPKLLANNTSTTITNVMFPIFSHINAGNGELKHAVKRSLLLCSYVIFPIMVGFAACANNFVIVFLTEKWLPCVPFIYMFCIYYLFKPMKVINQSCLKATGKVSTYMWLNVAEKVLGILLILVTMKHGTIYLALSAIVTYVIIAFAEMVFNGIVIAYSIFEQIRDLLSNVILSCCLFLIVFFTGRINISSLILLILQFVVGCSSYILLSAILKNESFYYLLNQIKGFYTKRIKASC